MIRWKIIYIDNKPTRYHVSDQGDVLNTETGRLLKHEKDIKGYHKVTLYVNGKRYRKFVHRLVAESFKPVRFCGQDQVNHKNGIKSDNYADNLEWSTGSENVTHALENELRVLKLGDEHHNTIFNEKLVHEICKRLESGMKTRLIRKELNITNKYLVSNIKRKKYWRHISVLYSF